MGMGPETFGKSGLLRKALIKVVSNRGRKMKNNEPAPVVSLVQQNEGFSSKKSPCHGVNINRECYRLGECTTCGQRYNRDGAAATVCCQNLACAFFGRPERSYSLKNTEEETSASK